MKREIQNRAGFSLVEMIAVVAVVGIIASIAAVNLSRSRGAASEAKLFQDVSSINRAIRMYQVSGGDVTRWATTFEKNPQRIVEQLKSVAEDTDTMAGLSGRMVDLRLEAVVQTADEAKTNAPRVRWDADAKRFTIARKGARGIKEFRMNEALAATSAADATEKRGGAMQFASQDLWVWDYTDRANGPKAVPTSMVMHPGMGPTPPGAPTGFKVLDPPKFSFKSGSYALKDYDLPLKLTNPNKATVSVVTYTKSHGSWEVYDGTPIMVSPGMTVVALAKPTHPDYLASSVVAHSYSTDPVKLELEVRAPAAVTYAQAGGAMVPGAIDFPAGPTALIALANADEIPLDLQSSGHFNVYWTYDGSDPRNPGDPDVDGQIAGLAPGLHMGDPFGGGFSGQRFGYELALWGSATKLPIKAVARSLSEHLVDSKVAKGDIGIEKMVLREPKILTAGGMVQLQLVAAFGDMPEAARIYYTTDGKDPKMKDGAPDGSTIEYTGPFGQGRDLCFPAEVRARAFGPPGYERWFEPSAVESFVVPAIADGGDPFFSLVCKARSLCGYSWFLLGGNATIGGNDDTKVNGDVAVGEGAELSGPRSSIKGRLIKHSTSGAGTDANPLMDLSQALADALEISAEYLAMAPTQSITRWSEGITIGSASPGAINIINIANIDVGGEAVISGGPDDWFVINVTNSFVINSGGSIVASGDINPSQVLFNIGPGVGLVKITGHGAVFPGTILAPTADIKITGKGEILGSLIAGGADQKLSGGAQIGGKHGYGSCE